MDVQVEMLNKSEVPQTVEHIVFEVREEQANEQLGDRVWETGNHVSFTHDVARTIPPGETLTLDVTVPTSIGLSDVIGESSGWMKMAGKAFDAAQRAQKGGKSYQVRASVYIEGKENPQRTTKSVGGGFASDSRGIPTPHIGSYVLK